MTNFHEHKLWQAAYVALMDLYDSLEPGEAGDLVDAAQQVCATIADSLTRRDGRVARDLRDRAVGEVAKTRTHLAVAWGRGLLDDEVFKKLDTSYDSLSFSLQ